MTDKKDLIRIMQVYEDTTGTYEIGDVAYTIFDTELNNHLKKYGKKDLIKRIDFLKEYVIKRCKELNKKKLQ